MTSNHAATFTAVRASNLKRFACWKKIFSFILLTSSFSACGAKVSLPGDGVFALLETDKGQILAQLEFQKTPLTVMSFVGLAEGRFDAPNAPKGKHYFDGLTFHRVEPGFVIQGGDPNGNGSGGPGYQFPNEIDPSLNHDAEGILSMANAGPDTNGSQFFITLAPASFLNGGYSVFGHVVRGMDVVKSIQKGDKINSLTILRQGAAAKAFQPSWEQFQQLKKDLQEKREARDKQFSQSSRQALLDFARQQWPGIEFRKDDNGLESSIVQQGNGPRGKQLSTVKQYSVHYTLWAPNKDGEIAKVDSSVGGEPIQLSPDQVIQAWGLTMPQMQVGERRILLVPSDLGYGKRGSPPVILPNSSLLFEMELINFVR